MAYTKRGLRLTEKQINSFLDVRIGPDFWAASEEDLDYRIGLLKLSSEEKLEQEMTRIMKTRDE